MGPMFRRERPQKGRYRQFYQIGAEVLGSDHPSIDAEMLEMLVLLLSKLGLSNSKLLLNSVGCANCRPEYIKVLRQALQSVKGNMCADCQRRAETNPLRVLDCKVEADQPIIEKLPHIVDHLDPVCRQLAKLGRSHQRHPGNLPGLRRPVIVAAAIAGDGEDRSAEPQVRQHRDGMLKQADEPMLRAKLYDQQRSKLDAARAAERRGQIGSGDRSERIRTYNFPQGRVTDHRINLTLYKLPQVVEGEALDELIDALVTEHQAELLAAEGAA